MWLELPFTWFHQSQTQKGSQSALNHKGSQLANLWKHWSYSPALCSIMINTGYTALIYSYNGSMRYKLWFLSLIFTLHMSVRWTPQKVSTLFDVVFAAVCGFPSNRLQPGGNKILFYLVILRAYQNVICSLLNQTHFDNNLLAWNFELVSTNHFKFNLVGFGSIGSKPFSIMSSQSLDNPVSDEELAVADKQVSRWLTND